MEVVKDWMDRTPFYSSTRLNMLRTSCNLSLTGVVESGGVSTCSSSGHTLA